MHDREHTLSGEATLLYGWAGLAKARARVFRPTAAEEARRVLRDAAEHDVAVCAMGAGQSYGDSFLGDGHWSLDMRGMSRILAWDAEQGRLTAEPGVTIEQALAACLPDGWILPVVPGTRHATLGGCVAHNVHGKNAFREGTFGRSVVELDVMLASGEVVRCGPDRDPALFRAMFGSAGLLGVVTRVCVQARRVDASSVRRITETAPDLERVVQLVVERAHTHEHVVAQLDVTATGRAEGRGVVHSASPAAGEAARHAIRRTTARGYPHATDSLVRAAGRVLAPMAARAGTIAYRTGRVRGTSEAVEPFADFQFRLDGRPDWRRILPEGFVELHVLVPTARAADVLGAILSASRRCGFRPLVAGLKRHAADDYMLTFAGDGISLGLDYPWSAARRFELQDLMREAIALVAEAGGKVNLSKDDRLSVAAFRRMYPEADAFYELKREVDPGLRFQSDMFRRLFRPRSRAQGTDRVPAVLPSLEEALDRDNAEVQRLYREHVNPGLHRIQTMMGMDTLDVVRAEGCTLELADGRRILDFTSAGGILGLGHNHPRIVRAERVCHERKVVDGLKVAPHRLQAALADNLARLLPSPLDLSFFCTSGAEAVEAALKLCERAQPRSRRLVLTTEGAYHGKTHGALSVTLSESFRDGFMLGIPDAHVVRVPYGDADAVVEALARHRDPAGESAVVAMIVEPIQGQGVRVPPEGYLRCVIDACRRDDVLTIVDEVKVGLCRTGSFVAFTQDDVVPDVLTLSKALGGGKRAIAAMVTSRKLFVRAYGLGRDSALHTTTFGGLGESCAVAIEALNVMVDERLADAARARGDRLRAGLQALARRHPHAIREIRGKGLFLGLALSFGMTRAALQALPGAGALARMHDSLCILAVLRHLYEAQGVLVQFSSSDPNVLHVMPPLVVTDAEIDRFVEALEAMLTTGLAAVVTQFAQHNLAALLQWNDPHAA